MNSGHSSPSRCWRWLQGCQGSVNHQHHVGSTGCLLPQQERGCSCLPKYLPRQAWGWSWKAQLSPKSSLAAARGAWRHRWSSACHGHPNYPKPSQSDRLSAVKSTQPTQTHTRQPHAPWPKWHSWTLQLHILTALDHFGPKFGIQCWEYSPAALGMSWAQLCGWASCTRTSNCHLINIKLW